MRVHFKSAEVSIESGEICLFRVGDLLASVGGSSGAQPRTQIVAGRSKAIQASETGYHYYVLTRLRVRRRKDERTFEVPQYVSSPVSVTAEHLDKGLLEVDLGSIEVSKVRVVNSLGAAVPRYPVDFANTELSFSLRTDERGELAVLHSPSQFSMDTAENDYQVEVISMV